jgi:pimeloyl-ACP methyl ester carboxylesterase
MRALISSITVFALLNLTGCTVVSTDPALFTYDQSRLPPADLSMTIAGLGPCTNNPDRSIHLNSQQPVTVLVHGCRGSTGNFRALAEVMAFHGQQAACFTYDDRDSLMRSSAQLATALDTLAGQMRNRQITVIGHSQGALVSRKALVAARQTMQNKEANCDWSVSAHSGIASAEQCGSWLTADRHGWANGLQDHRRRQMVEIAPLRIHPATGGFAPQVKLSRMTPEARLLSQGRRLHRKDYTFSLEQCLRRRQGAAREESRDQGWTCRDRRRSTHRPAQTHCHPSTKWHTEPDRGTAQRRL